MEREVIVIEMDVHGATDIPRSLLSLRGLMATCTCAVALLAALWSEATGSVALAPPPTVTIEQAVGQLDPTEDSPILFTVIFIALNSASIGRRPER